MIRYIKGTLRGKSDKRIVVFVGSSDGDKSLGIGYEIETPATQRFQEGSEVELYVSFQESQHQPVPRLYGFKHELERDFFEELMRVDDLGPSKALSAISSLSVPQIARAIVDRDVKTLKSLKGIGEKTAEKIIAELRGRAAKYALLTVDATAVLEEAVDYKVEVRETLIKQLQFKPSEAGKAVDEALKRNPKISCAEDLFDKGFPYLHFVVYSLF